MILNVFSVPVDEQELMMRHLVYKRFLQTLAFLFFLTADIFQVNLHFNTVLMSAFLFLSTRIQYIHAYTERTDAITYTAT